MVLAYQFLSVTYMISANLGGKGLTTKTYHVSPDLPGCSEIPAGTGRE